MNTINIALTPADMVKLCEDTGKECKFTKDELERIFTHFAVNDSLDQYNGADYPLTKETLDEVLRSGQRYHGITEILVDYGTGEEEEITFEVLEDILWEHIELLTIVALSDSEEGDFVVFPAKDE